MPILLIYSLNVFGSNLFVNGLVIIRLILMCLMGTLCFWTTLTTTYFTFMCLGPFEYLSFFEKKTVDRVITINFRDLVILLIIPSLEIKFCSYNPWIVNSKHAINLASMVRCSNDRLFHTLPWDFIPSQNEQITKWRFSCINTSNIIWIWISYYL